jgi:hypothetical protein
MPSTPESDGPPTPQQDTVRLSPHPDSDVAAGAASGAGLDADSDAGAHETVRLRFDEDAVAHMANRETVRLPNQRQPAKRGPARLRRAPLPLAATVTTLWAAIVSLAPVLVVVGLVHAVEGAGASANQILRLGLDAWLLTHGVPVRAGIGVIALAPLGLSVVAVWRVFRAGVHTARAIGARRANSGTKPLSVAAGPALSAGAAVGVAYGILGAIAAAFATQKAADVSIVRAGFTLALFGLIAGTAGALTEARIVARLVLRLPPVVRDGARTGVVAALLILGGGAGLAGMAVALNGGDASQIFSDYRTGLFGQIGLTLVCAFYGPNIAIWAMSYLVGPGFMLGVGTTVSASEVKLGPLPALPVLAGLPGRAATGWASLLVGLPVAAALLAGWLLARRALRDGAVGGTAAWPGLIGAAAVAGPVAGVLLGLVGLTSGGSLGDGHLAQIGPRSGWVMVIAAAVVAIGTALAASASKILLGVRLRRT